jgi:HAD superfamily PSPase-like hydrolase
LVQFIPATIYIRVIGFFDVQVKERAGRSVKVRRLVAFDLDGTLLTGTPSWEMLHEHFGTLTAAEQAHRDYSGHKIDYVQFMRRDLSAWPRPLKKEELLEVLGGYTMRPEAPAVVDDLRLLGYEIAIVTSALDIMAKPVARKLGIKYVVANRIGFDRRGVFNGKLYPIVEPLRKDHVLAGLARRMGVMLQDTVCVGDSRYDSSFLRAGGRGFVVGNRELAEELRMPNLENLEELLEHLKGS